MHGRMGRERDVSSGVALRKGYRFEDSDELARRNDVYLYQHVVTPCPYLLLAIIFTVTLRTSLVIYYSVALGYSLLLLRASAKLHSLIPPAADYATSLVHYL